MRIQRTSTTLTHSYQPASASFGSQVSIDADGIPDVSRLKQPVQQLHELAEVVISELDPYSRWVGKHKERNSLGAIALLPKELAAKRESQELDGMRERVAIALAGDNVATIPVSELVEGFPAQRLNVFSAKEASTFAQLLDRLGFGVAL